MPVTAKYPTVCGVCSVAINPGEEISKVGRRWSHVSCAPPGQPALPVVGSGRSTPSVPPGDRPAARAFPTPMPAVAGALEVWTDGACSGNPGPGGWAWATQDGRQASGGARATTNQRMEIQAVLEAVTSLDAPLTVVSDSTYVVNCFRDAWWRGWLARDWVNSAKKPVANRDLWEPLITVFRERDGISFRWVKGHSGDPMNDLVDRLAVEAGRAFAG
jgi:ribonuclease HI